MAIWFFHGKEEFKISKEIERLKKQYLDETFKSMNYRVAYSPDFSELLELCSAAPLMFGDLLSVIHCEKYFLKSKNQQISFSDEQIKDLEFAIQNISASNHLVFICNIPRNEDKKIDSRTKLFKLLAKYSNIQDFPEYRDYDSELISYIQNLAKEKNLSADTKTVKAMVNQCGVNLRLIDSELEKLKIAIYPNKKFSEKEVTEYCVQQQDAFAVADLVISSEKNTVMKKYFATIEKSHPLEIIALLQSNLHKLLYIKTYQQEKTTKDISIGLGIPEYPVKLLQEKIKNISLRELSELKHNLTVAEFKIKTGKTQNPEYLLESVLLCGGQNV